MNDNREYPEWLQREYDEEMARRGRDRMSDILIGCIILIVAGSIFVAGAALVRYANANQVEPLSNTIEDAS